MDIGSYCTDGVKLFEACGPHKGCPMTLVEDVVTGDRRYVADIRLREVLPEPDLEVLGCGSLAAF